MSEYWHIYLSDIAYSLIIYDWNSFIAKIILEKLLGGYFKMLGKGTEILCIS